MKIFIVFAIFLCLMAAVGANPRGSAGKSRQKRSLLALPHKSQIKVTMDLIVPVSHLSNTSTFLTFDLPFSFSLPSKKDIEALLVTAAAAGRLSDHNQLEYYRSLEERQSVYSTIGGILSSFGFDGESCAQRAICEAAQAPVVHHGLLGQIINLLLTPTIAEASGNELGEDLPENIREKGFYFEAFRAGLDDKDCAAMFSCPLSLFQFLYMD